MEFIKKQRVSLIASVDGDGFPNMKAMLPPSKMKGNTFYYSTNISFMHTQQYIDNEKASIYFYKKGLIHYKGIMLVDPEIKKELWSKMNFIYYKKGVSDPSYCFFKFTATKGSYYYDLITSDLNGSV